MIVAKHNMTIEPCILAAEIVIKLIILTATGLIAYRWPTVVYDLFS